MTPPSARTDGGHRWSLDCMPVSRREGLADQGSAAPHLRHHRGRGVPEDRHPVAGGWSRLVRARARQREGREGRRRVPVPQATCLKAPVFDWEVPVLDWEVPVW
jgi:hypothetical protein